MRKEQIHIFVSAEELTAIKNKAWRAKKPMSVFLRDLALSSKNGAEKIYKKSA